MSGAAVKKPAKSDQPPALSNGTGAPTQKLSRDFLIIQKNLVMELFIQGKVAEILEEQSGESRNGPWRRRDFILEMDDRFSRKVCISQWGDSIDSDPVSVGETVKAYINLQSREYNGRWYTDVRAWRIDRGDAPAADDGFPDDQAGQERSGQRPTPGPGKSSQPESNDSLLDGDLDDVDDDLPF